MAVRHYLILLLFIFGFTGLRGQMLVGTDTLIGNEWITYGQRYFKFTVDADGIYRIPKAALDAVGISAEAVGSQVRIYSMGRQVPLFVSTDGAFGLDDFIEFYGYKNRGEMDRTLYRYPDKDMLNPDHSLYTDQRPYYLTTSGTDTPERVTRLTNDISNPPAAEPYILHKEVLEYNVAANDPYYQTNTSAISYSSYLHAEGFGRSSESNSNIQIPSPGRAAGPDATLHLRLAGTNYGTHRFIIRINDQLLDTIFAESIQIKDTTFLVPLAWLQDANQITLTCINAQSRQSIVRIELTYPHIVDAGSLAESVLELESKPTSQYIVLNAFAHNGSQPVIYTADGKARMIADINGSNQVHFVWPQVNALTALRIVDPATTIRSIQSLEQKTFTDLRGDDTEYIVITHPDLMEIGTESAYIQYRSSAAGGSYRAKAYSILDLYEQFGYGIDKHPQAIRNFVEFMQRNWPSAKMIFIIGRGIEYHRSRYASGAWEPIFFVPTFGRPGADNLLAATLWDLLPRYPIGRLAITTPEGIAIYLSKVKEHDLARYEGQTLADKKWIKNVMHLGGGKTVQDQADFKSVLTELGDELAASDYGANISFFQKTSTEEVGESESAQILKLLQEGCGVINYLGHSATSTFEFSINDPSEWNNKGHYPIFSAMGCSAGQIHGPILGLSDNYVQIPDEGAIAFISGSGSQFPNALEVWAHPWYNYFGNLVYGATLGESVLFGLKPLKNFINLDIEGSNSYRYLLEQQTLQGDPALQMHPLPGPDYIIDPATVSISPDVLNTKLDSVDVHFSVTNIGRNLRQDVNYTIKIRLPDGQDIEVGRDTLTASQYNSVLTHRIPLAIGGKSGAFRLLISIDPQNTIEELPAPDAEDNNQLIDNLGLEGIEFFVIDNLMSAVYPPDFSIVTETIPELIATGSNAFSKSLDIVLEIDTTALFNSPSLVKDRFVDHSSTLKWSPPINWVPDQVYYWRVSTDSISPDQGYHWSRKSFLYKPDSSPGWNQSHFHQFTDNDLDRLLIDSTRQSFTFGSKSRNFIILNRFQDVVQGLIPKVVEDGILFAEFFTGFRDRNVQAFVVAIDSLTGNYILNPNPGLYGSFNHLAFDARCFAYRTDLPESRQALINFVDNIIPAGYYVFFYTYSRPSYPDYFPEQWADDEAVFGKSIFSMIEHQYPASAVRTLATTGSKPYIIYFQKDRGVIQELIAQDSADVISMSTDIMSSLTRGSHISRLVGPATQWYSILNDTKPVAVDTAGKNILSAIALSSDFSDTLVISNQLLSQDTVIADIDAATYPYIRLTYSTEDSITFHPADLEMWRVLYEGNPEFVIQPDLGFEFIADTLNRGESLKLSTYVENVSAYDVDTLPVALRIISADNTIEELTTLITNFKGKSAVPVAFTKNTSGMNGDYQVYMEVNPGRTVSEVNYANNIGVLSTYIRVDDANPVLDVTFDGYHIKDGDLVASKPLIAAQLHDENENLRLDDTSLFELYLEYPSDFDPQPVYFTDPRIHFIPSPLTGKNVATVEFTPELLEDGIYTLQVNAKDASGNPAGDNDYIVSFEVINDASVSNIYNYPNPFSASTRFIYTLTGSGSPAFYKIEIRSVTGILVREITQDEMGPMAVGGHMTEYAWDGKDNNGNELAAGMYLYRLVVKDEQMKDYPHYSPYGDGDYNSKGWGKLVLVR